MSKNISIGTDIGGSHISCAAVDMTSGEIIRETSLTREVDSCGQAGVIISLWANALTYVLEKVGIDKVKGVGFAMPGPFDYVNGISYIHGVKKFDNLYSINISDALTSSIDVPDDFLIRFINDTTAFAVGESWVGCAAGVDRSLSITLGTGLGSAFIKNGIPVVNGNEVPKLGCVYHLPYKDGIADDYFSSRGLLNRYHDATRKSLNGVSEMAEIAGVESDTVQIFEEFGDDFAMFLSPWIKRFGVEILVMGGNISNAYNLFGGAFEKRLKNEGCDSKVTVSVLKEDAALLGSAFLFNDEFWNSVQGVLPLM